MAEKKNEKNPSINAGEGTEGVKETAPETAKAEVKTPSEPAKLTNVVLPVKVKTPPLAEPDPAKPETVKVATTVGYAKGVKVKRLANYKGLPDIAYQTDGAAGMDLYAAIQAGDEIKIPPFSRVLIPTGLSMEIPVGYEGQIRPRSGLALKQGLTCLNTPGTIDADYRGEVGVILYNASNNMARVKRGDRVAQIVFAAVARMPIEFSDDLSETDRGDGGFGSTGV